MAIVKGMQNMARSNLLDCNSYEIFFSRLNPGASPSLMMEDEERTLINEEVPDLFQEFEDETEDFFDCSEKVLNKLQIRFIKYKC